MKTKKKKKLHAKPTFPVMIMLSCFIETSYMCNKWKENKGMGTPCPALKKYGTHERPRIAIIRS